MGRNILTKLIINVKFLAPLSWSDYVRGTPVHPNRHYSIFSYRNVLRCLTEMVPFWLERRARLLVDCTSVDASVGDIFILIQIKTIVGSYTYFRSSVTLQTGTMTKTKTKTKTKRYSDWLRAGRPRFRSSSPGRIKKFLFSKLSRPALGSTQPPIPGVKRPGREADHSPVTSAEVKKMWIYASTLPYA
jgi:hypothetical protein